MRILCVGDVTGTEGCRVLAALLPGVKRKYGVDLTLVNGENSAEKNGLSEESARSLFSAGADVITGGNHSFKLKRESDYIDTDPFVLCPGNLSAGFGKGVAEIDIGAVTVGVLNASGIFLMPERYPAENPFQWADRQIEKLHQKGIRVIVMDFHGEATSEKNAMGRYLDGRISVLCGTHTHVPTADARILPGGTGYVTDLGMTGPTESILGADIPAVVGGFVAGEPFKLQYAKGPGSLTGCIFDVDAKTGLCTGVLPVRAAENE